MTHTAILFTMCSKHAECIAKLRATAYTVNRCSAQSGYPVELSLVCLVNNQIAALSEQPYLLGIGKKSNKYLKTLKLEVTECY